MVDVQTAIEIACPLHKVAEYAANPDNAPEWYANIKSVEWKTPRPLKAGSMVAFQADFLGRRLTYTYEAVEYVPGSKLVMRTAEGPFPMETVYTWESVATGVTRMTLRNRGKPSGFSIVFAPFMALMMKRANNQDLKRIKSRLEKNR